MKFLSAGDMVIYIENRRIYRQNYEFSKVTGYKFTESHLYFCTYAKPTKKQWEGITVVSEYQLKKSV